MMDAAGHPVINPAKFKAVARKAIRDIGYEQAGFHWKTARIDVLLHAPVARHRARASTTPPTSRATKAPATRASCSAMPAARRRT